MTTTHTTATEAARQLDHTLDDLTGITTIPPLARLIAAATDLAQHIQTGRLTREDTCTLLATLAGGTSHGPDLTRVIAGLIAITGDPATNPALRTLTPTDARTVRTLTRQWAAYDQADFPPRDLITEATTATDPHTT